MDILEIDGPCQLHGDVELSGAKNAALPIVIAAFACQGRLTLKGLPNGLRDIQALYTIFRSLGGRFRVDGSTLHIDDTRLTETVVSSDLSAQVRVSLLLMGVMLGRYGRVTVGLPGGCKLGDRKFDLHVMALRQLGATVDVYDDRIEARADKLVGADIEFPMATTGGTENALMAACFAKGRTRLLNAHTRPEIVDLANMLNRFGAKIRVYNRRIEIDGTGSLGGDGEYTVMRAWDEAVTFIAAAGICRSEIRIRNFDLSTIPGDAFLLNRAGIELYEWGGDLYVKSAPNIQPIHLVTGPYPAVNSDMQPIYAALAAQAMDRDESTVTDQRFPERFGYVGELRKTGMDIVQFGNCAVVRGGRKLSAAAVRALDLRCGAALAINALACEGRTRIDNIDQIHRGYEDLAGKLRGLGVSARVVSV